MVKHEKKRKKVMEMENASNGPNGTENAPAWLEVPRKAVLDKSLSKTALRVLALLSDPLMDNLTPEWDDDVYARILGVQSRTVRRAVDEIMAAGYYKIPGSASRWGVQ